MDVSRKEMTWFDISDAPSADFAVIGDPISHSLSPQIHQAAYSAVGLDYRYVAIRVPAGRISASLERLRGLGYKGVNVTIPLKEEAFAWCRNVESPADSLGVVNAIKFQGDCGTNTDAPAFLKTLAQIGTLPGAKVLVLGAGGTARALIPTLAEAGYRVSAWNRTRMKLEDLAAESAVFMNILDEADPTGQDVVINTTSVSLHGEDLPVLWDLASERTLAYDVMYSTQPTRFLASASQYGLKTKDGKAMLVEQAALSFEWWTGMEAPREAMLRAAHEHS